MEYLLNVYDSIFQIANNEKTEILLLIIGGIFIRILLQLFGQNWIKTISNTGTLFILPVITYIITKVIAGNIALSLGMVGALSIVRFRNPVRSPLELCVYFAAITTGISTAVNLYYSAFFYLALAFTSIILFLIALIYKKVLRKDFFSSSFSEGNSLSTLEVISNKKIEQLENNEFLKSKSCTNNTFTYLLASNQFENLNNLLLDIKENKAIQEYQINQ